MDIGAQDERVLSRLMSVAVMRSKVLAHNISNQNTPGFRRRVVQFEDMLHTAMQNPNADLSKIQPKVVEDGVTPGSADGNNVHMELELNAMRENRLLYETYASILQGHFELLRSSIEEG